MLNKLLLNLTGEFFNEKFIRNNLRFFLLVLFLLILFILNRFACTQKMLQIEALKKELQEAEYENRVILNEVTTRSRQSQIEQQLKEKGINLSTSKNRIYEIKK